MVFFTSLLRLDLPPLQIHLFFNYCYHCKKKSMWLGCYWWMDFSYVIYPNHLWSSFVEAVLHFCRNLREDFNILLARTSIKRERTRTAAVAGKEKIIGKIHRKCHDSWPFVTPVCLSARPIGHVHTYNRGFWSCRATLRAGTAGWRQKKCTTWQ